MSQLLPGRRDAAGHFEKIFGRPPTSVWSAPGRINLIGEHTDYNAGLCLPLAVDFRADCACATTRTGRLRIASAQRPGVIIDLAMRDLVPGAVAGWAAYVAGALWSMSERPAGADIMMDSDIPIGAGLSSSAALECATLGALGSRVDFSLARAAQRAENAFVGVPCGIMDQLASTLSLANHGLLFDARAQTFRAIPVEFGHLELLVLDTRAPHQLADGAYALRRRECFQAARLSGVASLREAVDWRGLPDPLLARARHVMSENARVLHLAEALEAGNVDAIGPILSASHASLRDDFAVSTAELDTAVEAAMTAGAVGARMTGGGFGGSIIALTAEPLGTAQAIEEAFARQGWAEPQWFIAEAKHGLVEIT